MDCFFSTSHFLPSAETWLRRVAAGGGISGEIKTKTRQRAAEREKKATKAVRKFDFAHFRHRAPARPLQRRLAASGRVTIWGNNQGRLLCAPRGVAVRENEQNEAMVHIQPPLHRRLHARRAGCRRATSDDKKQKLCELRGPNTIIRWGFAVRCTKVAPVSP